MGEEGQIPPRTLVSQHEMACFPHARFFLKGMSRPVLLILMLFVAWERGVGLVNAFEWAASSQPDSGLMFLRAPEPKVPKQKYINKPLSKHFAKVSTETACQPLPWTTKVSVLRLPT